MAQIKIENLSKSYFRTSKEKTQAKLEVLKDFSLEVKKGEFVTIFGPNGCGKTTLLNIIGGLLDFDNGVVKINGKPSIHAKIGYVFQNFRDSLFPWRTNIDNIALPLEVAGISRKDRIQKVRDFLKRLEIEIPENSYPYQQSGGQQQMIAILRALISEPSVLLMDEPFNGLDYQTRVLIYKNLFRIWQETKTTILCVSHDIEEAVFLASRLILLSKRPANIVKMLHIDFPYPRTRETINKNTFKKLEYEALLAFHRTLE